MKIDFEFPDDLVAALFSALGKGETPQSPEEVTAIFLDYGITIAGAQKQQSDKATFEDAIAKATPEEIDQVKAILKIGGKL